MRSCLLSNRFVNYEIFFQLSDWVGEKVIAAQDETYRDAKNIHSKYMRHQAFESEIKANKDRLERLIKEATGLLEQKPELAKVCYKFTYLFSRCFAVKFL